jgi:hypothetical protein
MMPKKKPMPGLWPMEMMKDKTLFRLRSLIGTLFHCIVPIALFVTVACMNSMAANPRKESVSMLEQKGVDYPIQFANYQANAFVPFQPGIKPELQWEATFSEEYENLPLLVTTVLVHQDFIGIRSKENLLVYRSPGLFQYMVPIAETAPVVFGASALAYFSPSLMLNYQDYAGNPKISDVTVPGYDRWSVMLLILPLTDEFISVSQFTGGPKQKMDARKPKHFGVFRLPATDIFPHWSYEEEGEMDSALLTGDLQRLVLVQDSGVVLLDTQDGAAKAKFALDYLHIDTISLDAQDRLQVIGSGKKGMGARSFFSKFDLNGKLIWDYEIRRPLVHQPPASGSDGRVYTMTDQGVSCLQEGMLKWHHPANLDKNSWITVCKDNIIVLIHNRQLIMIDKNGTPTHAVSITSAPEHFDAPAAVDSQGRIFVASDRKLYCFK